MSDEIASFAREITIHKNRDTSILSRGRDNPDIITDLKLRYEEQLEKLRVDLQKERSKNKKFLTFFTQRAGTGNF